MDAKWAKIFSSTVPYKAELTKGLLQEEGVDAVIVNKKDSAYLFGEVEVFVPVDQVLKAKQILKSRNTGE